jgi:hypothetical protein
MVLQIIDRNIDFEKEVFKKISYSELMEWLKRNPMPDNYGESIYFYAYYRMRMGWVYTFWRKNILGWEI